MAPSGYRRTPTQLASPSPQGRFPANIILDEEAGRLLDLQSGISKSSDAIRKNQNDLKGYTCYGNYKDIETRGFLDKGGASRFFYCAKASKNERNFGLDILTTIKLIKSKEIELLWKEENMELAQLLLKDILGLEAMSLSIGESGENIKVTFQKDCLSTTRMEINKITELKTWNSLMHLLTKDYIQDVFSKKEDGLNHAKFVENLKKLMMTTGISQEKVGLVMEDVKNATYLLLLILKGKEEKDYKTNKNFHPTVKSLKLMEYLIKLVSREGAIILDPFLGSGTTGVACAKLNRNFIGIEKEEEYVKIAKVRLKAWEDKIKKERIQKKLK